MESNNDIFCMACREKLGYVVDHNYIHLLGWDRKAVFDIEKGTVTVKCKCGVGRVIRNRGNHDEGLKESMDVWLETNNDSDHGEHEDHSQGAGEPNQSAGDTKRFTCTSDAPLKYVGKLNTED